MGDNSSQDRVDAENLVNRRKLLESTGAVGLAGMASLAGCNEQSGTTDNETTGTAEGDATEGAKNMKRVSEVHMVTATQEGGSSAVFEASRTIASNLEDLGMKVNLDPQSFPQPKMNTLYKERSYDMTLILYLGNAERLDPAFYLNKLLHSSEIPEDGWNFSGYDSEKFDNLAEEQLRTLDRDTRQELVYEAQKVAFEDQAVTTYASPNLGIGLSKRFEKPEQTVPGEGLLGMRTLTKLQGKNGEDTFRLPQARDSFGAINPTTVKEAYANQFLRPIYDTLMRVKHDGTAGQWIINDIEIPDKTTATVTLKENLTFHNGEPVTTEDVKFSFEYLEKHKAPYFTSYLEKVDSVSVEDDRTVTFALGEPYAPFQIRVLSLVPIIPKHIWKEVDEPSNYGNQPAIGSGPFEWSRLKEGSLLEYKANADHPQAPNINTLQVQLFGSQSAAQQALLNGDLDGMEDVPTGLRDGIRNSDAVRLFFKPSHSITTFYHNIRHGKPYSDRAFRRAVAHLIPNEEIVEQLYGGYATPGGSVVPSALKFWSNPDIEHFAFDKQKARQILKEAGYDWDDQDRLRYPAE